MRGEAEPLGELARARDDDSVNARRPERRHRLRENPVARDTTTSVNRWPTRSCSARPLGPSQPRRVQTASASGPTAAATQREQPGGDSRR